MHIFVSFFVSLALFGLSNCGTSKKSSAPDQQAEVEKRRQEADAKRLREDLAAERKKIEQTRLEMEKINRKISEVAKESTEVSEASADLIEKLNAVDVQIQQFLIAVDDANEVLMTDTKAHKLAEPTIRYQVGTILRKRADTIAAIEELEAQEVKLVRLQMKYGSVWKVGGKVITSSEVPTKMNLENMRELVQRTCDSFVTVAKDLARIEKVKIESETFSSETTSTYVPRGGVVEVKPSGERTILSDSDIESKRALFDTSAFDDFRTIAKSSGGYLGLAHTPADLSNAVDFVVKNIAETTSSSKALDIALVIDTTSSMSDDIDDVKANVDRILAQIKTLQSKRSQPIRVALVLFRDQGDAYVTKVQLDFTSQTSDVNAQVQAISVDGGGDVPEAVLDALLSAKDKLSWATGSQRKIILIGDAPAKGRTSDGKNDMASTLKELEVHGAGVVVYPIITKR